MFEKKSGQINIFKDYSEFQDNQRYLNVYSILWDAIGRLGGKNRDFKHFICDLSEAITVGKLNSKLNC